MAKKQSDYLADILSDEGENALLKLAGDVPGAEALFPVADKPATGSPRAGMSLVGA